MAVYASYLCSFLNGGFVMRVQMVYSSWFTPDLPWKACLCVSPVPSLLSCLSRGVIAVLRLLRT